MTATLSPVTSTGMDRIEDPAAPAKPAPNYARQIYWSVNLILLVLVPILLILGWFALRSAKADYEDRQHADYCQTMEEIFGQAPDDCP